MSEWITVCDSSVKCDLCRKNMANNYNPNTGQKLCNSCLLASPEEKKIIDEQAKKIESANIFHS